MNSAPAAAASRVRHLPLLLLFVIFSVRALPAGNVHVVEYASQSDVKIFVVRHESEADLCVRRVRHESQAGGADEFWHYVKYESQADVRIFFVEYESQADIRICFVSHDSQAGWRRENPFQGRFH